MSRPCGSCASSIGGRRGHIRTTIVFQVISQTGECLLMAHGACRSFPTRAAAETTAEAELSVPWEIKAARV